MTSIHNRCILLKYVAKLCSIDKKAEKTKSFKKTSIIYNFWFISNTYKYIFMQKMLLFIEIINDSNR